MVRPAGPSSASSGDRSASTWVKRPRGAAGDCAARRRGAIRSATEEPCGAGVAVRERLPGSGVGMAGAGDGGAPGRLAAAPAAGAVTWAGEGPATGCASWSASISSTSA